MSRGRGKSDIVAVPGKWVPSPGERVLHPFDGRTGTVTRTFNQWGQDVCVVSFGTAYAREVYLSQLTRVTT